jgi:hypothetical protein
MLLNPRPQQRARSNCDGSFLRMKLRPPPMPIGTSPFVAGQGTTANTGTRTTSDLRLLNDDVGKRRIEP